jgi:hypothetical protein
MGEHDASFSSFLGLCVGAATSIAIVVAAASLFRGVQYADSAAALLLVAVLSVLPRRLSWNSIRVGGYAAALVALVVTLAVHLVANLL